LHFSKKEGGKVSPVKKNGPRGEGSQKKGESWMLFLLLPRITKNNASMKGHNAQNEGGRTGRGMSMRLTVEMSCRRSRNSKMVEICKGQEKKRACGSGPNR